ncbi:MAG TPA: MerR family transcriptional regulator [Bacteroidetes bacterium]|nr:MerR family transcriptional regulator [Bacteroidota bacterium]
MDANPVKLYYSIGEVSRLLGIDQHVLRFWETEFRELAPLKRKGGRRQYRESDLRVIRRIKKLLYEDRYTIEGARRRLRAEGRGDKVEDRSSDATAGGATVLKEMRRDLLELKEILESQ